MSLSIPSASSGLPFGLELEKVAQNIRQQSQLIQVPSAAAAMTTTTTTTTSNNITIPDDKEEGSDELAARQSARTCLEYWCRPDSGTVPAAVHPECAVTLLLNPKLAYGQDTKVRSCPGRDLELYQGHKLTRRSVVAVKIVPFGARTVATCQVELAPPAVDDEEPTADDRMYFGFLTLLKASRSSGSNNGNGENDSTTTLWTCISAALDECSSLSQNLVRQVLPSHFAAATQLTWNGYCAANRACDGVAMSRVFHPTCRLTFVGQQQAHLENQNDRGADNVVIVSSPAFCDKVQQRYSSERNLVHAPYVLLQMHGDVGQYDRIEAVEFATPHICLVSLKVGHPPCLWHDVLTCCHLGGTTTTTTTDNRLDLGVVGKRDSTAGWWILHKSSCMEDYRLTREMKEVLTIVDHVAAGDDQEDVDVDVYDT